MSNETLTVAPEKIKTVEYRGGTIKYKTIGESNPAHHPILIIPGYTEGHIALTNFAEQLADERQVLVPEQPNYRSIIKSWSKGRKNAGLSAVDHQAEAMLAIIEDNDLSKQPVDLVAHSFGALILERAAELAQKRQWTCFDADRGARSVLIAPAGTYDKESLFKITPRFTKLLGAIASNETALNPKIAKNGPKEFISKPIQHTREVWPIARKKIAYDQLANLKLRPFILQYVEDPLYSDGIIGPKIVSSLEYTAGYASPIDATGIQASSFEDFRTKFRIKNGIEDEELTEDQEDKLKEEWSRHYRSAGHNDLLYNPQRTARAVLQFLDN